MIILVVINSLKEKSNSALINDMVFPPKDVVEMKII